MRSGDTPIDVVTFDIFDTLLHRRVLAPVDVFELVRLKAFEDERSLLAHDILLNFTYDRMDAERRSRIRHQNESGGEGEVTFDEIYREYSLLTGCREELTEFLKSIELDVERHVLVASHEGMKVYEEHRNAGRRIAFISDMYLPSDWLRDTLQAKGFSGADQLDIFVSGEHRLSKHTGKLFQVVKEALGVADNYRWLHVGDNLHADVKRAKEYGIRTLHADWGKVDNRFTPTVGKGAAHIVASIIAFLDTRQAAQYIPADNLEAIGYRVFGPLLFGFNAWLMKACRENKLKDLIFVARDGWLLKQLFESCKDVAGLSDVTAKYFFMSRKIGYQVGLREWDSHLNWYLISSRTPKSVEKSFRNANLRAEQNLHQLSAFGLEDIHCARDHFHHFSMKHALDTMFQEALAATKINRDLYKDYFNLMPERDAHLGLVDIGWAGNIQKAFVHTMNDYTARDRVIGLYLGTLTSSNHIAAKGFKMKGWLCNGGHPQNWEHLLVNGGVELLEFLLTADHGSALELRRQEDGQIVPIIEDASKLETPYREKAMRVQSGVRRFFDDYKFLLSIYEPATLMSDQWVRPFERLVTNPTQMELDELASLTHSDSPGSNDERLPLASRQPLKVRLFKGRMRRARNRSYWKAAFDKLNR